ncbi:MAG: FHA domain-containing protein [Blastochloris sp.]|nr:FHA domain-containing protein [Blastochloris sp.]
MARTTLGLLVYRRADGAEEYIQLRQGGATLGRDATCTFVIAHPAVSRQHARIELQGDHYAIVDVGSANGTFVNGVRINDVQPLRSGDEVWLGAGDVALRFSDPEERLIAQPSSISSTPDVVLPTSPQAPGGALPGDGTLDMTSTRIDSNLGALLKTRLPMLQIALDIQQMTEYLAPLLRPLASDESTPVVTYAKVLDYTQGEGGKVEYTVTGINGGATCTVIGRLYSAAGDVVRRRRTMQTLWGEVFARTPYLNVPQPLGVILDLPMLCYVQPDGQLLSEAIIQEHVTRWMEQLGAWLGILHRQRLSTDRPFQIQAELANVQAWAHLVEHTWPAGAEAATRIAGYLHGRAGALTFATDVPIHGDFHYGHVLVNGGVRVVESDTLYGGDPHVDLAHFCAYLRLLVYRRNMLRPPVMALQSAFLRTYTQQTGWSPNERFAYFFAYTCLKIAKQLCSRRGIPPHPDGDEQRRQVLLILQHGLSALPKDTNETTAL